jgi:tetratricopeptide (TPR) repeat protein
LNPHDLLQGGSIMSMTLNFVDSLLAMGRKYQDLGRDQDAWVILNRLAGFREVPAKAAEEAQVRLAEIQLRRLRHVQARRHLTAALALRPDSAYYHYLMATALDTDKKADSERAAAHYRRSLELDPDQPHCLSEFGRLGLRLGQTEEGLRALRRAADLAPDDPEVVARLAEGLSQAGLPDEARRAVQAALFRNPRDLRFRKLWSDIQFHQLRDRQQEAQQDAEARAGRPQLLPFVRPVAPRCRVVRRDTAVLPRLPGSAPLPDQKKHA